MLITDCQGAFVMTWRFLIFLSWMVAGWLAGGLLELSLHCDYGPVLGCVTGALLWFLLDTSRAVRLLRWLRSGETDSVGLSGGVWGDIAGRVRRLLRQRDRSITDAENRLHDFLLALQASPNGVVLLNPQARIEWCNQTAASHFGLNPQRDVQQVIGNLVRDPAFADYLSARKFGSELQIPGRNSTPTCPVNLSVQIHPYGGGRLLLLSRDVTALEQALAMRRDFVANVSHEIRTPLSVLAGFVETMQTLDLSEAERERYLHLMAQQAVRMQTLVSDLLTLSRLEGSPVPGVEVWTRLTSLMQQLEQDAQALTQVIRPLHGQAHHLVFECQIDVQVAGVAHELHSAMSNLVSNAVRYTPAGGNIGVRVSGLPDGRAEFVVTDTGPGIAPEHLPRLTERFYRVDRSRSRETGGTGLGLAIVKHVVQRHGAELIIDSQVGQGTTFHIVFPAVRVRPGDVVSG